MNTEGQPAEPKTSISVSTDGDVERISFSLDVALVKELKHTAVDENVSKSAIVEVAIRRLLALAGPELHSVLEDADASKRRRR